jgi:hypothetical protein
MSLGRSVRRERPIPARHRQKLEPILTWALFLIDTRQDSIGTSDQIIPVRTDIGRVRPQAMDHRANSVGIVDHAKTQPL